MNEVRELRAGERSETGDFGNNVSKSPKEKTDKNQHNKYDFVLNNYTEEEVRALRAVIPEICIKGGWGHEVGESGTPHLQGGLWLKKRVRFRTLQTTYPEAFGRASFRLIRNEEALIKYIQKDGDTWLYGFPKPIKTIENLYDWQQEIVNIYNTEPDDRKVYWFWESVGGVGKSQFVKYMVVKYKCLFCDGGKKQDLINLVFNNNMDECKAVIWDIPRSTKGRISYATLESIKNGLVCNTKYETGVKVFNSPHIFVFANFPPDDEEQLSADRWVIKELPAKPAV